MQIRRIGALSLAKVLAVIYAVFGLIFGLIFSLIALPIFYGLIGFIGGLITAWLYNAAARIIGGIELELE